MIWVFWSFFLAYFVKLEHPPVLIEEPLSTGRKILGWSSLVVFVLCISPLPIYFYHLTLLFTHSMNYPFKMTMTTVRYLTLFFVLSDFFFSYSNAEEILQIAATITELDIN